MSVLPGAAGGGFTPALTVAVGRFPTEGVVADFNADGHDDLAIASSSDRYVSVRLGAGDGTFTEAADAELTRYPFPLGGRRLQRGQRRGPGPADCLKALAVGDFDSDGNPDVAAAVGEKMSRRCRSARAGSASR